MKNLIAAGVVLGLLVSQPALGAISEDSDLARFLEANGLPSDTVEQIIEQELDDPYMLKGATYLSPTQALRSAAVERETIERQIERIHHTYKAIGVSALLATAGVVAMITPLPGTQAIGVVLLKQGAAVGATALAVAGGGAYALGSVSEMESLGDIKFVIQNTLNEILKQTPAGRDMGEIVKIKLNKKRGIKAFHTANGYDFKARDIEIPTEFGILEEEVFVSYTAWTRYRHLERWTGVLKEIYNGKVISLVDLVLYPLEKFVRLRSYEEREDLTLREQLEYAGLVGRQILGAMAFRTEVHNEVAIDQDRFREILYRLDEITPMRRYEPITAPEEEIEDLLDELLTMRERI